MLSSQFIHGRAQRRIRVQRPFVPPAALVDHKARRAQKEERLQVRPWQRLRLEDRLHERHVHERQLHHERHRDRREQHLVLSDPASQAPVLKRGDEVQEDEARKRL